MSTPESPSGEFLTQDEVDALLKGVNLEEEAQESTAPDAVRTFNAATQERIARDRGPALAMINDRFLRAFRGGLGAFLRRMPEVALDAVRTTTYSEFLGTITATASFNIMQVQPSRNFALFVFDAPLVSLVVDQLFGGDGRFAGRSETRDFTATEQRIIQRLVELVTAEYRSAWSSVHDLEFTLVRSEQQAQHAAIAAPGEVTVVSSFGVQFGTTKGVLHICMPCATLEPIRELKSNDVHSEPSPTDRRWSQSLANHMQNAEVQVVATLATLKLTLRELLQLQVGSIVPIDIDPAVRAEVDGVPLLECQYGVLNGRYALRVNRVLKTQTGAGVTHA
ncbi:MAG TPA: flagellar motor switch protein FliM [Casimicrobiaceae bacterium]|nr:flagellar motor switch protein FliM [Casimicrobiaceae bacterium]